MMDKLERLMDRIEDVVSIVVMTSAVCYFLYQLGQIMYLVCLSM
jgi:hypothetical protein